MHASSTLITIPCLLQHHPCHSQSSHLQIWHDQLCTCLQSCLLSYVRTFRHHFQSSISPRATVAAVLPYELTNPTSYSHHSQLNSTHRTCAIWFYPGYTPSNKSNPAKCSSYLYSGQQCPWYKHAILHNIEYKWQYPWQ